MSERNDKKYEVARSSCTYKWISTCKDIYRIYSVGYSQQILQLSERADAKSGKKNYMAIPPAIRELEKIELLRKSDCGYWMDYAATAIQKEILKAFDKTAVSVRTQAASINEDLLRKKRQTKNKVVFSMTRVDFSGSSYLKEKGNE